jgi:hypothetical protein
MAPTPAERLAAFLAEAYPSSDEGRLAPRAQQVVEEAFAAGLDVDDVERQLQSWKTQFPLRRDGWVGADGALTDLRRLLLGPQGNWAAIWRGLRKVATVASEHYLAVAGAIAALGGAFYGLAYTRFYESLGITPEQAGFAPTEILAHSVLGGVMLVLLVSLVLFSTVISLVPLLEEKGSSQASGDWWALFANVCFTLAGISLLFLIRDLTDFQYGALIFFSALSIFFLVVGSLDFGHRGWRPTVRPSLLKFELERYVVVIVVCAIPALALAAWVTVYEAKRYGEEAAVGKAVNDPKIGIFPFLGVRAEPALVSWKAKSDPVTLPRCVLYLGTSDGDAILYDHRSSSTFHLSADDVVLDLKSSMSSCEAPINVRLPQVTAAGEGELRCGHGGWHSQLDSSFRYEWFEKGHPVYRTGTDSPRLLDEEEVETESVVYCRVTAETALGENRAVSAPMVVGG